VDRLILEAPWPPTPPPAQRADQLASDANFGRDILSDSRPRIGATHSHHATFRTALTMNDQPDDGSDAKPAIAEQYPSDELAKLSSPRRQRELATRPQPFLPHPFALRADGEQRLAQKFMDL
jgi:hypothetical protein